MLRRTALIIARALAVLPMVGALSVSASAAPSDVNQVSDRATQSVTASAASSDNVARVTQRAAKSGSFWCAGQSWTTSWQNNFGDGRFHWAIGFNRDNQRMAKLTVREGGAANLYIEDKRETGVYRPDLVVGSESNGYAHCHFVRSTSNTVNFVARRSGNVWRTGLSFPPMS